jgi:hypothetical protein
VAWVAVAAEAGALESMLELRRSCVSGGGAAPAVGGVAVATSGAALVTGALDATEVALLSSTALDAGVGGVLVSIGGALVVATGVAIGALGAGTGVGLLATGDLGDGMAVTSFAAGVLAAAACAGPTFGAAAGAGCAMLAVVASLALGSSSTPRVSPRANDIPAASDASAIATSHTGSGRSARGSGRLTRAPWTMIACITQPASRVDAALPHA